MLFNSRSNLVKITPVHVSLASVPEMYLSAIIIVFGSVIKSAEHTASFAGLKVLLQLPKHSKCTF